MKSLKSRVWKWILVIVLVPVVVFAVALAVVYAQQDAIVQELLTTVNRDFRGEVTIEDSHISPFAHFPYVSVDLDHVRIYEDKTRSTEPLLDVEDVYLGFDIASLLRGTVDVRAIRVRNGSLRIVQHPDGEINLLRALSAEVSDDGTAGESEELPIHLRSIELTNVEVINLNEETRLVLDSRVARAKARFRSDDDHLLLSLNTQFVLTVAAGGDTTFARNKHFDLQTQVDFHKATHLLTVQPSKVKLEKGVFDMEGSVDIDDSLRMDLRFRGNKPNFDLLMAFVPEELVPTLQRYDNQGKIFFEAKIEGKAAYGYSPYIEANFGCEDAFFNNRNSNRKLDALFFKGHFSNGELRHPSTMEFSLLDVNARPEAGLFEGYVKVRNFLSPEIDTRIKADLDLDFLAKFLDLQNLRGLRGHINLTMNFHDIIDLKNPEKSLEQLNQSYFTRLSVRDLAFQSPYFHLPLDDLDIEAEMEGTTAVIDRFHLRVGNSDLTLRATVSDLPAILHHTADPVMATLEIESKHLDLRELTSGDTTARKPVDEQLSDFRMKMKFNSSARAFTESPNLPVGEFFIEDLFVKPSRYPHVLHDFHADVYITETDFRVIDFTGMIDESDFHFTGNLRHYDLWFMDKPRGDTQIRFDLVSEKLQLHDLFSYGGENYVPEDYRHEEFSQLKIKGQADLHFQDSLQSSDLYIQNIEGKMKVHPLKLEQFRGRVHWERDHLVVENLSGRLGHTSLTANLHYYLGTDETRKERENYFSLKAPHLDFDQLFNYNPPPAGEKVDHDTAFNIYELPFTRMSFAFDIDHLNYHRILLDDFHARLRTTPDHYIYVDTLSLRTAGGKIGLKGYFNGSDKSRIYFSPQMMVEKVDLDKLLFKFENFGQDHLVSENLHGRVTGTITGKVRMYPDLVPILDDSDLAINFRVMEGRLERYSALSALSDFFGDKNLAKIIFDTLQNQLVLRNGVMTVPAMTINSSLGFIEVSGRQDLNMNMEYYVRVPWRLVTQAGAQKLFGKKQQEVDPDQVDAIQYRDPTKRVRFINLKITGTPDNYKISLGRDRSGTP